MKKILFMNIEDWKI